MSRVRATEQGYDNIAVRQPGEEFTWPDTVMVKGKPEPNPIPAWCELLEPVKVDKNRASRGAAPDESMASPAGGDSLA